MFCRFIKHVFPFIMLVLFLSCGAGTPLDISGLYILEKYEGENAVFKELTGKFGFMAERAERDIAVEGKEAQTIKGYNFIPVVLQEGEVFAVEDPSLSDPPWFLKPRSSNRYEVPITIENYIFYFNIAAGKQEWEGNLIGPDENSYVRFKKQEN